MSCPSTSELYEGSTGTREEQDAARRRVHWLCAQAEGSAVLDVLCADGLACVLLAREGKRLIGVEPDASLLAKAESRLAVEEEAIRHNVRLVAAEAHELPFAADSFDTVLLGDVPRHVDLEIVMSEAVRVLRRRGRLVLTLPYGVSGDLNGLSQSLDSLLALMADMTEVDAIELMTPAIGVSGRAGRGKRAMQAATRSALQAAEARLEEVLAEHQVAAPSAANADDDPLVVELIRRRDELEHRLSESARKHAATAAALDAERDRLIRFEIERDGVREEANDLRALLKRNREDLDEQRRRFAELQAHFSGAVGEKERALEELSSLRRQITSLGGELSQATAERIPELERARTEAETRLEAAESSQREVITVLKAELTRTRDETRVREEAAQHVADSLRAELAHLTGQRIPELERTRVEAETRLEAAESSQREVITALEAELTRTRDEARVRNESAQHVADSLRLELAHLTGQRIPELERTRVEADAREESARRAVESLEVELRGTAEQLARAQSNAQASEQLAASLERRLHQAAADWEELERTLSEQVDRAEHHARSAAASTEQALCRSLEHWLVTQTSLQSELAAAEIRTRAAASRAEEDLRISSDRWSARLRNAEAELHTAQQRADDVAAELKTVRGRLEREVAELRRRAVADRDRLGAARKDADHQRREAGTASKARDRLHAHVEQLSLELKRVAAALSARELSLREHASQLHEAREGEEQLRTTIDELQRRLAAQEPRIHALEEIRSGRAYRLMRLLWRMNTALRPGRRAAPPELAAGPEQSAALTPPLDSSASEDTQPGPWDQGAAALTPSLRTPVPVSKPVVDAVTPTNTRPKTAVEKRGDAAAPSASAPTRPRTTREIYNSLDLEADRRRFAAGEGPVLTPSTPASLEELRVAAIVGAPLRASLAPICRLTTFRPDNWAPVLDAAAPHVLLVESTWVGNTRSWQHRVPEDLGRGARELAELIEWCRARAIPTAYWFTRPAGEARPFLRAASLFDAVFSADPDAVPVFQQAVGPQTAVSDLALAADLDSLPEPPATRTGVVWVSDRCLQATGGQPLASLLGAARAHGLRILDDRPRPDTRSRPDTLVERFADHIVPCPDRQARLEALLSANAVLVAGEGRRIPPVMFDAAACGTAIIVAGALSDAPGLPDGVATVASADDMNHALTVLEDDDQRREMVTSTREAVLAAHTYRHRLAAVAKAVGVLSGSSGGPSVVVQGAEIASHG